MYMPVAAETVHATDCAAGVVVGMKVSNIFVFVIWSTSRKKLFGLSKAKKV